MTENEQIQEMARDLCHVYACEVIKCGMPCNRRCKAHIYATRAIAKGYRKVERGEWIFKEYSMGHYVGICTICEGEADMTNFCPYCGADMRGGLDNEQRTDN
jgi:hypothetical protein